MPWDKVMEKFKAGALRSSSGEKVTDQKQALAIMLSEKKAASQGKQEYQPRHKDKRGGLYPD